MKESTRKTSAEDRHSLIEEGLRARLIDLMIVMCALGGVVVFLFALLRSRELGWTVRDGVQLAVVVGITVMALIRRKVPTRLKALFLVFLSLTLGMIGLYTLGMLAGGVFFFPIAAVIMSLFFTRQTVTVFALLSMLFIAAIAAMFVSGRLTPTPAIAQLMASSIHWVVYVFCLGFFFLITCVTILTYRQAMSRLMAQLSNQRDEMDKINHELLHALSKVKMLSGLLSICASCKKVRDDEGTWNELDFYTKSRSEAKFSQNICPDCARELYPDYIDAQEKDKKPDVI